MELPIVLTIIIVVATIAMIVWVRVTSRNL
jgi:hypothetical protein